MKVYQKVDFNTEDALAFYSLGNYICIQFSVHLAGKRNKYKTCVRKIKGKKNLKIKRTMVANLIQAWGKDLFCKEGQFIASITTSDSEPSDAHIERHARAGKDRTENHRVRRPGGGLESGDSWRSEPAEQGEDMETQARS
jgi:hypothetical protein